MKTGLSQELRRFFRCSLLRVIVDVRNSKAHLVSLGPANTMSTDQSEHRYPLTIRSYLADLYPRNQNNFPAQTQDERTPAEVPAHVCPVLGHSLQQSGGVITEILDSVRIVDRLFQREVALAFDGETIFCYAGKRASEGLCCVRKQSTN